MEAKELILEHLSSSGERLTLPRRAVIDALCELGGHQTTQNIQQYLATQKINIQEATIYRVLQWLKNLAVVSQTDLGQSGIVYELLSTPPHHHLVCLRCGQIWNVNDTLMASLRQHIHEHYGFEPRIDHMAIFGICQHCQAAGTVSKEDH